MTMYIQISVGLMLPCCPASLGHIQHLHCAPCVKLKSMETNIHDTMKVKSAFIV